MSCLWLEVVECYTFYTYLNVFNFDPKILCNCCALIRHRCECLTWARNLNVTLVRFQQAVIMNYYRMIDGKFHLFELFINILHAELFWYWHINIFYHFFTTKYTQNVSSYERRSGPRLNIKTIFPCMWISMLKIKRSRGRLIFNMGIFIQVRRHLYIETPPCSS